MAINKMFVMLPVMLAARKLDGEDPNIVFMLRIAYGGVQSIIILLVAFMFFKASQMKDDDEKTDGRIVYVPPPPQPFGDADGKKKYTQIQYAKHVQKQALTLLGSTLFGVAMTAGMHWYKGMVVGLAMQAVMGPFNMFDSPLFKKFFLGQENVFDEKTRQEIMDEGPENVEVVDGDGNTIVLGAGTVTPSLLSSGSTQSSAKSFEDILLDTWDEGEKAQLGPLMKALDKSNINYQTKTENNSWTPLMVICGLNKGVKGIKSALKQAKALGADASMTDSEGWNALHWSAFHGSAEAATFLLLDKDGYHGIQMGLHKVLDKEGKSAEEHAKAEGNDDVAKVIADATSEESETIPQANEDDKDGLRKRK